MKDIISALLTFAKSALFSLFILTIIGVYLPKAPQVNSIVVNLYEYPINFAVLLLIAPIYAIILVHYPSYFNIDEKRRKWYMAKPLWIIGIIFYTYKKGYRITKKGRMEGLVNFLFRILGILFFGALFYMIGYTSEVNFDWPTKQALILSLAMVCVGVAWLYLLKEKKKTWLKSNYGYLNQEFDGFYDGDYVPNSTIGKKKESDGNVMELIADEKELKKIKSPIKWLVIFFSVTFIVHVIFFALLFSCKECRYTNTTAILSLVCIFLQMISFIYYRNFRSVLRFTFFNKNYHSVLTAFDILRNIEEVTEKDDVQNETQNSDKTIEERKQQIITFFENHDYIILKGWIYKLFSVLHLGARSNNIIFLRIMAFFGVLNLLFLIIINLNSYLSLKINSILIILSSFFFYYGVIVVLTKNFIYFRDSWETHAERYKKWYYTGLMALLILAIGTNRLTRKFSNNLFTLQLIEQNIKDELLLTDYVKELSKDQTRYYIGSYGGGMKANAWTLTVLKNLYDNDSLLFQKTVGISGASGGTMGLINLAAIVKNNPEAHWDTIIHNISTSNILSLDLTHILGRDTFSHLFVPGKPIGLDLKGKDRSTAAMNNYAKLSKNQDQIDMELPYREYWKKIYENNRKRFPILIANTTNVKGNQGMAVSVRVENDSLKTLLYHGADNILDIIYNSYTSEIPSSENRTLSYYDAASTSNRFPLISPAARIETKGHYNDGGIYENSGLLSVLKLFRAVNRVERIYNLDSLKQRNVFINIVNDKNLYIKHKVGQFIKHINKINKNTEINAILSSVASTEMFPIYVKTELSQLSDEYNNIEFKTIYLPHRFSVADIKAIYGRELDSGSGIEETSKLLSATAQANDSILIGLITRECTQGRVPIIEPPMSRVMAKPAYRFMRQMLVHETVKGVVQEIVID